MPRFFFENIIIIEYNKIKFLTLYKNMQLNELKEEASRLREKIIEILRNV